MHSGTDGTTKLLSGNHVLNMPVALEASELYKIASTNAFLLTTENISGNLHFLDTYFLGLYLECLWPSLESNQ